MREGQTERSDPFGPLFVYFMLLFHVISRRSLVYTLTKDCPARRLLRSGSALAFTHTAPVSAV